MTPAWGDAALSVAVSAAEHVDIGAPPILWGIGTFVILMLMLAITLALGRGRG